MAKPRVTATNRLSNIIDVVEMGRRSGMLCVERGSGSILEVGEIYFVSGSPIYASLAGLRGREALSALGHWGPCRFAFDTDAAQPRANLTSTDPSQKSQPGNSGVLRTEAASVYSATPGHTTGRLSEGSGGWTLQTDTSGHSRTGGIPHTNGPAQTGPLSPPQSGILDRHGASEYSHAHTTSGLGKRPRRAPDVRDLMTVMTTHNLSRNHRTVLILADGEHTILDLARLSSKSVDEVMNLLADLEVRGLVYYYATE